MGAYEGRKVKYEVIDSFWPKDADEPIKTSEWKDGHFIAFSPVGGDNFHDYALIETEEGRIETVSIEQVIFVKES